MARRRIRSVDLGSPDHTSTDGLCELLLVRHGEQELSPTLTLGEARDSRLSERGREQARALGARLARARIDAVYSSDLVRAHDTAREVARHHGLEARMVPELREIELWGGAPQDKRIDEVYTTEELTRILRAASRTRRWDVYPHSEDAGDFRRRVTGALDGIAARHHGERVLVAAHGGVINAYLGGLVGAAYDQVVSIHHTAITVVRAADERRAVLRVNDYTHLARDAADPEFP